MTTTLKTIKQAANDSGIPESLVRAVVRKLGRDYVEDAYKYGIGGGFPGFTYGSETVAFFKRHRGEIVALVERQAKELGENPAEMVAGFGCLAGHAGRDDYDYSGNMKPERRRKLAEYLPGASRCLYGGRLKDDDAQVANALAWFAAEEVCRALVNE